ncbi:hypothetical protein GCM10027416_07360 [Okibacterium endophyticum]
MRGSYRYTLGSEGAPWFLIAGESVVVALRPPVDPGLVDTLWALVRRGSATLDDVLRDIPDPSLQPGEPVAFSVIERTADRAHVFVHGSAVVDVGTAEGWQRVATRGAHPWRREEVTEATRFSVGDLENTAGGTASGVSFALGSGVVVADRLDWAADARTTSPPGVAGEGERVEAPQPPASRADHPSADHPSADRPSAGTPAREASGLIGPPPAAEPLASPDERAPAPGTTAPGIPAPAPAAPLTHSPAPSSPPAASELSQADMETVIRRRKPSAPAHDDSLLRHDGETVLRRDIEPPIEDETVLRQRPFVPDDPQTVLYGFRINGGQAYPLDAVHYFGRNPRQPRIPLPDPSRLVPVVSASKSVSATHLEVKQVGDAIVATDLRSTNGTSVILPGKHWQRLRAGETIVVVPGTFIDIGDGNVIEILPPWPGV